MAIKRGIKFALTVILCGLLAAAPVCSLSKRGSVGQEVLEIQQALKEKGYYSGELDGIYGSATEGAVKAFQNENGLSADGIAGEKTLSALEITAESNGWSSSDYELLARTISAEARGEEYLGQVAVGAVILNRVEHPSFPDTISGVIYQNGAFSCLDDGQFYEPVAESAYSAARDALNGLDPSGGAVYYYNPATATSKWIYSREVITTIGAHVFCK